MLDSLPSPQECRRIREAAGVSQLRLALAIGASKNSVWRWEGGGAVHPLWRTAYLRELNALLAVTPERVHAVAGSA